jgi:hypothetical protein
MNTKKCISVLCSYLFQRPGDFRRRRESYGKKPTIRNKKDTSLLSGLVGVKSFICDRAAK